ncbi:MAG: MCP four helix bundle domain-containing protein, partial [Comamonas sp.]|nr:MCP four helix bundle domain-containing protein [Comamonas sp.]
QRLWLGFACIIVLGLVVAASSYWQLGRMSDQVQALVEQRIGQLEQVNQVKEATGQSAIAVRNILLLVRQEDIQAQKQNIDASSQRALAQLRSLVQSTDQANVRDKLGQAQQTLNTYQQLVQETIAMVLNHQRDQARQQINTQGTELLKQSFALLDEVRTLEQSALEQSLAQMRGMGTEIGALVIGMAVLVGVLSVLIAWSITRFLARALGGEPAYAAAVAREIAAGNLAVPVNVAANDQHSLLAHMRDMRNSLVDVVAKVRSGSQSVAAAGVQISQGNQDLSMRTESQASALQQTASAMDELGARVTQNADNARQANQLAQTASAVAAQGGAVVDQVVSTMEGITTASHKIADIIQVIDGIAFQTNILALNAAVEAARAGEQGRGFAVVAAEVRSLAGRSAEAAKEIKQLIDDSVERVEQGASLVDQAGVTMQEVVQSIRRVTDIMGEISAATQEQSAGISQVGSSVAGMDQATQQNAALVEQVAAAASSLNHQAQDLVQAVAVFDLGGQTASAGTISHAPRRSPSPPSSRYNSASASMSTSNTKAKALAAPSGISASSSSKALAKPSIAAPAPTATPATSGKGAPPRLGNSASTSTSTSTSANAKAKTKPPASAATKPAPRPTPSAPLALPAAKKTSAAADDEWETF